MSLPRSMSGGPAAAGLPVLMSAMLLLGGAAVAAGPAASFQFRPDIHGDQIVFTSEGDLWLGSIETGSAQRLTSHAGSEGPARFSPDGRQLAFTAQYDGGTDVYVMDTAGGLPRRLTWDPSGAVVQDWTPDGNSIVFRSQRQGQTWRHRMWSVPAQGGCARLLELPYGEFVALEPEGRRAAFVPISAEWQHWKRYRGGMADDLWLADLAAGTFRRLTEEPGIDTTPLWLGGSVYFVSDRDGQANLHRLDPATGARQAVTNYEDYDVAYPATDGARIIFEHGQRLALYDPASGASRDLSLHLRSDRIHAREKRVAALDYLEGVALGPTGRRVLVSARGTILSVPVRDGDVRVVAAPAGGRCRYPAWSADGRQIAFVSDVSGQEEIYVAPSSGGAARQVTRNPRALLGPLIWSPDGRSLATSDREMRIFVVDVKSGEMTLVDQSDRGGTYNVVLDFYRFSPDGNWLAYVRLEPNWNSTVHLYNLREKTSTRVSSASMNSFGPAFDPAGRYLYFLSDRAFDPQYVNANRYFSYHKYTKVSLVTLASSEKSPFLRPNQLEGVPLDEDLDEDGWAGYGASRNHDADGRRGDEQRHGTNRREGDRREPGADILRERLRVDVEGLSGRVVEVPVPADHWVRLEPLEGRLLLASRRPGDHGGPFAAALRLSTFETRRQALTVLADSLTDFQVSADRRKLLIQTHREFTVIDAGAREMPDGKGDPHARQSLDPAPWVVTVDPASEWRQIFLETWRIAREFFYDPGMHGADWEAVRKRYEPMLAAVADRSELDFVLGEMLAELNCGHAYIGAGDEVRAEHVPMGFLGADLEPSAPAGDSGSPDAPAYRVTRLYPGDGFDLEARSPLLTPGVDVKAGDYILAVAGQPVRFDQDIQALLAGTAGRPITLTVNSRPSLKNAREVLVRPLASEYLLRYYAWVESRRDYVRARGGPELAYLHLPDMGSSGLREFAKHYYPNLAAQGFIYDVRFNGGGYIDAMLLLQMSSKPYSWFKPRYGASWTRQDWAFAGHAVALVNDQTYSDGEEFCDAFRRLKLGPVIGTRSWGGEVGSGDGYRLVDGGSICIPNYGEWVPEGEWVIEGTGVIPDLIVEEDPAAAMAGRDPQLDRAIEALQEKIAREPVPRPQPPPFPVKTGKVSAGR